MLEMASSNRLKMCSSEISRAQLQEYRPANAELCGAMYAVADKKAEHIVCSLSNVIFRRLFPKSAPKLSVTAFVLPDYAAILMTTLIIELALIMLALCSYASPGEKYKMCLNFAGAIMSGLIAPALFLAVGL